MPQIEQQQSSFAWGEISPFLHGRSDLDQYSSAAAKIENAVVMPYGGVTRRPGTIFVDDCDFRGEVKLIPFQFSTDQSYILAMSASRLCIFQNGKLITKENGSELTIGHLYIESDLRSLKYIQSNDVLYLVTQNRPASTIKRYSQTDWRIETVEFTNGPYLSVNDKPNQRLTLVIPAGASEEGEEDGTVTIKAGKSVYVLSAFSLFSISDIGRFLRIEYNGTWGYGKIMSYIDNKQIYLHVMGDFINVRLSSQNEGFPRSRASRDWQLGAFSGSAFSGAEGYPSVATFFEQRLWLAGSKGSPNTIWGSRTGSFEDFTPTEPDGTVADDDGISFTIASTQNNAVLWLESLERSLIIGTSGGPFSMSSGEFGEPITPSRVSTSRQTTDRCSSVDPVVPSKTVLYSSYSNMKLHEIAYVFEDDGYRSPEMTLLAEHIARPSGIKEIAYAKEPFNIVWVLLNDGTLLSFTYVREQQVTGWARHEIAGFDGNKAKVESIAVIPDSTLSYDELWMAVSRGSGDPVIERLAPYSDTPREIGKREAVFLDSSLSYSGDPTTTLSGLDHLEGQEVAILGDGAPLGTRTVDGGQIELDDPVSKAVVGLPYTSKVQTLDMVGGNPRGTSMGKKKRIVSVNLRLYRSANFDIGTSEDDLGPLDLDSEPLYTGIARYQPSKGWDDEAFLYMQQSQPLPWTLLSYQPLVSVGIK